MVVSLEPDSCCAAVNAGHAFYTEISLYPCNQSLAQCSPGSSHPNNKGLFGRTPAPPKTAPALASLVELEPFSKIFGKTASLVGLGL